MPQQPKPASESGRPAAERQFVDREEPIAIFQAALKAPQGTKPLVLVFHGGAGTGKSRLRRELARQLAGDPNVVTATLDFDVPVHRQPDATLFSLRKAIGEACQACFPSFDLAYAVLWQKSHPDTAIAVSGSPNDEVRMTNEAAELGLGPGSLLSQLLDQTGRLPLIGLVPKISSLLAGSLDPLNPRRLDPSLRSWWERRGERELEDLPQMEPAEIVEQLPKLLAADMKDCLSGDTTAKMGTVPQRVRRSCSEGLSPVFAPDRVPGEAMRRAVLFVDSYEKLWGTGDGRQETDAWVRELVKQLPEALWVISGRQKLRWEEAEKEWGDVLSQHELGALPEHSARQFLSSCGITDEPIQEAIAKGSQGLPHYLNLAVDTFLEIKQSGQRVPVGAESASTPEEVFAQFIRHLDQPEIATLQILSASRFWNYGLFEHLVTEYQTGYPLTAYDDLSRFSFIGEGAAPETRTMHDLMREALQEHQAPELRKRVHLFLHELYAKQLEGLDVKGITEKHKAALPEAFYHGRQAKSAAELRSWFDATLLVFNLDRQHRLVTPLYREMAQALEIELGPNHPDTATALLRLAAELTNLGEYAEAEPLFRRALAIAARALGPEHELVRDCLVSLARLLTKLARYDEAEALCRRMVGKLENEPGGDAYTRASALDDLALVLTAKGKHAEAEELFRRELVICENELGPDCGQTALALNNVGVLLFKQARYPEAEPLFRRALSSSEKSLETNHPGFAKRLGNLAATLRGLGRYAEAEPLVRRALRIKEETLGPDHPSTTLTMCNLGALLGDQGRYTEAELLMRRALAVHERKMGPDQPGTMVKASNLVSVLVRQGNHAEAEPMVLSAIATREQKLGPDHPETASVLHWAGVMYSNQGRYAEAEGYLRRALDVQSRVLGPEHQHTLASLDAMASLEERRGRRVEAESLYRDVLEKRERVQGPDHPDVAATADRLAGICGRDGRYAEAEALYRRALAIREEVFGPDHLFVAEILEGLAKVCEQTGRSAEAQELSARAKRVRAQAAGEKAVDSRQ